MFNNLFMKPIHMVLVLGLLGLGACNTVEGVGQDVEAAGDGIEDAARDAKNY